MNLRQDPDNLRSQLVSLEELQELLLYIVTHDLRSPVMTILGFADLLTADWQNHSGTPSQLQEYIERIRSAAYRQGQIVDELQRIVTLVPQSIPLELTDLSKLVQEMTITLRGVHPNVEFNINPNCQARCDTTSMTPALQALLSNAAKLASSSPTPQVVFGNGQAPFSDQHCFQIQSNGTGFELGPDQRLLGFFRCLQSDGNLAGAGLALLQAAFVIHRHGGKLWIKSDPLHGTILNFTVPT